MYMQNTCSAHGLFFPSYQGERCPACVQREVEEMLAYFEHWLHQDMYEQADERLKYIEWWPTAWITSLLGNS